MGNITFTIANDAINRTSLQQTIDRLKSLNRSADFLSYSTNLNIILTDNYQSSSVSAANSDYIFDRLPKAIAGLAQKKQEYQI